MSAQEQFNKSTLEIYKKISKHVPEIEWKVHAPLIEKINRLKKEIYVGTRVIFFTFVNLIKFPFYINLSMITLESFKQSMMLFPLSVVGILIGYQILKHVKESLFYNIIYALILITSSKLVFSYIFQ